MNSEHHPNRRANGSTIAEFGAGLVVFVCVVFIPVIDMSFVPARFLLVQNYLEKVVHHMAVSEKRSEAIKYMNESGNDWKKVVETFGVTFKNAKANLLVLDNSGNTQLSLPGTAPVPKAWLPTSTNQSRLYSLELVCDVDIPPLFKGSSGLPGFSKPIAFTFRNRAQWENLSPDPLQGEYYINE